MVYWYICSSVKQSITQSHMYIFPTNLAIIALTTKFTHCDYKNICHGINHYQLCQSQKSLKLVICQIFSETAIFDNYHTRIPYSTSLKKQWFDISYSVSPFQSVIRRIYMGNFFWSLENVGLECNVYIFILTL